MSIYRYTSESPISAVQFRFANDRPPVALVHANVSIPESALDAMRKAMAQQGWQANPANVDGKPVLQVFGFDSTEKLTTFLARHQFTRGEASITPEVNDELRRTWREWLNDTSLKACGWGNMLGDVSLLIAGIKSGSSGLTTTGALYTAGGAVLAKYGNVKTAHHVQEVTQRTAEFLRHQAGSLPEGCGLADVLAEKQQGVLPQLEHFLYRYPSQTTIGIYTLGAFAMMQAGIQNRKFWDIAYGANSTLAGAASILIPERKKEEKEKLAPANGVVEQWWNWLREKPLRAAGYAYIVSDIALGMSAYKEFKDNPAQKSYVFKFVSAGAFLVSSALMAISNKDQVNANGLFDSEERRGILAQAAEVIAQQPEYLREPLVHQLAGFLSQFREVNEKAETLAKELREQVKTVATNPWACKVKSDGQGFGLSAVPNARL